MNKYFAPRINHSLILGRRCSKSQLFSFALALCSARNHSVVLDRTHFSGSCKWEGPIWAAFVGSNGKGELETEEARGRERPKIHIVGWESLCELQFKYGKEREIFMKLIVVKRARRTFKVVLAAK